MVLRMLVHVPSDLAKTRSCKQNSKVEFDSALELNQISHVTNFGFSDWSICQCRVKFYAGILLIRSGLGLPSQDDHYLAIVSLVLIELPPISKLLLHQGEDDSM